MYERFTLRPRFHDISALTPPAAFPEIDWPGESFDKKPVSDEIFADT
jgi:hypothetical protein